MTGGAHRRRLFADRSDDGAVRQPGERAEQDRARSACRFPTCTSASSTRDDGTRVLPTGRGRRDRLLGAAADDRILEPPGRNRRRARAITSTTAATRRWLHTGDLGYLDDDGYVFIVDRKKDLIKTSGYQVWPREVEEVLAAHPAVAEVGVAGVPDDTKGEAVKAWVVLRAGQTRDRGGAARVLPRDAGALQGAVADRVPDGAAEDDGRQGAAPRAQRGRIDRKASTVVPVLMPHAQS